MKEKKNKKDSGKRFQITGALLIRYLLGIVALLGTILLVYRGKTHPLPILVPGQIAAQEIRAQVSFDYVDEKNTEVLRRQAEATVESIYYLNPTVYRQANQRVEELFAALNIVAEEDIPIEKKIGVVSERVPWLDQETIEVFLKVSKPGSVKANLLEITKDLLDRGVISSTRKIRSISTGDENIKLLNNDTQEIVEVDVDQFIVGNETSKAIDNKVRSLHPFDRSLREAMATVLVMIISANVNYDTEGVKKKRVEARELIVPVGKSVKRGQTIIRRGDPVTEIHRIQLEAHQVKLQEGMPSFSKFWKLGGYILFGTIFLFILGIYLHYHQPEIFSNNRILLLLLLVSLGTLALARFISYWGADFELPFWQFFVVVPICTMLVAILIDRELAIMLGVVLGMLVTVATENNISYTIVVLFGSIISVRTTASILHRWEFIKAGFLIGLAQMVAILMVNLLMPYSIIQTPWQSLLALELGGLVSGLSCAMVVSIFLPVLERTFNVTTDIRLLEIANLNHPLLKMLLTKAPGTYHHCIAVGNLAEEAAAAIGANPLLAKAASYFHDIGKTAKPEYFVENVWFREESRHEKLLPKMSHLVITAHVKDGVQLAKRYRLPQAIIDIIAEHHGTSLVYYFYRQATKQALTNGTAKVDEGEFRYPGPRPHSKESGIILLADSVEAASKTLVKPTPVKIEDLVKDIVNERLISGQLNSCGLTLKEIGIIRERFTYVLTGMLHTRVEYPNKDK